MRVSLDWVKDYVDIDVSPSELAEFLTMAGLEVEGVEEVGLDVSGVEVAQIVSIDPHPQADGLSLCQVKVKDDMHSIVCGARNMKTGDKVALALAGAQLAHGVKITTMEVRGERSEGRMCSEAELGLTASSDGVMILPPETPLGVPVERVVPLRDYVLEVCLTPNRGDCLGMIGIAREIAALTEKEVRHPVCRIQEGGDRVEDCIRVSIVAPDLCPRYSARVINDVQIGPSPLWLRVRLERAGMRPINNVVDVTNFVMLEYGQPLHAFDLERLQGGTIIVKRAEEGETFLTLDGVERTLDRDTLMICDGEQPVAIGGIMGGLNSEIEEDTTHVLLESAYFSPAGIRRTSKALGLQTESSYRFERGIDVEGVLPASLRATALIAEVSGGHVAQGVIDEYPIAQLRPEIRVRLAKVNGLLGMNLRGKEIEGILRRLGMRAERQGGKEWIVTPPTYRADVLREVDIIEEIGRVRGYEAVPVEIPKTWILPFRKRKADELEASAKEVLNGLGLHEVITYSFISPRFAEKLRLPGDDLRMHPLALLNPLTEDQSVMRTTLLPGLLDTARYNVSHKNLDVKIFELREIFLPKGDDKLPEEKKSLAGLLMGIFGGEGWNVSSKRVDFYDVKGCIETLLAELRTHRPTFVLSGAVPYLHPRKGAVIRLQESDIGVVGELHPEVAEAYELPSGVYVFEFDWPTVLDQAQPVVQFNPLPRYPSVTRDVAVVVDEDVDAEEIGQVIRGGDNTWMESVELFDCYRGDPIPTGKKGLAFRIRYRSMQRTLTDEEVNRIHEEGVKKLRSVSGLTIRQ